MLETIAIVLVVLWLLGFVSLYTMGGFISARGWGSSVFFVTTEDDEMTALKVAAIVLIVAGVLGLVYGSFSYTKETHEAKLGRRLSA